MTAWDQQLSDESPGYLSSKIRMRECESRAVGRLLLGAAAVCVIRVAVLPWLTRLSPSQAFGQVPEMEMIAQGLVMMACFAMCGMLARMRPLAAVGVAAACLGIATFNDLQRFHDLIQAGIINKSVLGLILIRAFITALVGRLM
jgi:hypothetical protein